MTGSAVLPSPKAGEGPGSEGPGIYDRTTRGQRIHLSASRLRGLLALNLAIAAASVIVIVNAVVLLQAEFGIGERATALALTASAPVP